MMSKKHYLAIAAVMRSAIETDQNPRAIAVDLARVLADDNPRFDIEKFLAACEE